MMQEMKLLVEKYRDWLKDNTDLREVQDHVEITTPFIDRHNDFIQIYAQRENGGYVLTDAGYTIDDLAMSGCSLDSPKRQDQLRIALAGFGVQEDKGALLVHATDENFALRKHSLIQSVLAVNDLFYLAKPYVASLFLEDVAAWLEANEIRFTPRVNIPGKSGFENVFNFVIPKSKNAPERLLKAINDPTKDAIRSFVFAWSDVSDVREPGSKAYAILNDSEKKISSPAVEALRNYDAVPMNWSERNEFREALAA